MKRSSLYETQRISGARFVNLFGWEVAEVFTSLEEEYATLCEGAGLLDCSQSGVIEIRGDDRVRFLHGMLTNDIKKLKPGSGCYAGFLTPQGRLIADLQVYCLEDSLWLTLTPAVREKVPPTLRKYILGDRPELIDRSEELSILSLQGKHPSEFLEKVAPEFHAFSQTYDHQELEVLGINVRICRVNRLAREGYDLIVPTNRLVELWERLLEAGQRTKVRPVGFKALNTLRVEAGIPWYEFDMDEKTLPLEAGLENEAISLTKGCYLGQESVARITYRGQLQRKLAGFILAGETVASKGDKVFKDDLEEGWVTSSVMSIALKQPIALGYLRREVLEPGTLLRVGHPDRNLAATVVTLPFVPAEPVLLSSTKGSS